MDITPRPRSEQRKRSKVLTTRVDAFEDDTIRKFAQSVGMSIGSYVRDAAMRRTLKTQTTTSKAKIISDLARAVSDLKRMVPSDSVQQQALQGIIRSLREIAARIVDGRP